MLELTGANESSRPWRPIRKPASMRVAKAGTTRSPRIGFSIMKRSLPEQILQPHLEATERPHAPASCRVDRTRHLRPNWTTRNIRPRMLGCLNRRAAIRIVRACPFGSHARQIVFGASWGRSFLIAAESLGKADERTALPIEEEGKLSLADGISIGVPSWAAKSSRHADRPVWRIAEADSLRHLCGRSAAGRAPHFEYVIRAREDRCTPPARFGIGSGRVIWKCGTKVSRSKLRTTRTIELCQTDKRAARQAYLEIRAIAVQVKPPHARSHLPSVTYNVVLVEEVGGPGDGTDLCWLLITTLPIETVDDVLRIIDYYVARWMVEIYFRTLKTGCRVEEIQLRDDQPFETLFGVLQDHRVASIVLDVSKSHLSETALHSRIRRERMEVGLASRHEETASEQAACLVKVHATTHATWRLQQPHHRGATGTPALVGRTSTHDRLRHRPYAYKRRR